MVGVLPESTRDSPEQPLLYGFCRFTNGQAGTVGDTEDVCIHGDRWPAEGAIEHDIGCFAANSGKCFERFTICRHFATMVVYELPAGRDNMPGLAAVEPDGADGVGQPVLAERQKTAGVWSRAEEWGGGGIDTPVRCLCRKNDRNQKLERAAVFELGFWRRIGRCQSRKECFPLGGVHRRQAPVGTAALARARSRCRARASSQFLPAIMNPSKMKPPGGRMASRKPG